MSRCSMQIDRVELLCHLVPNLPLRSLAIAGALDIFTNNIAHALPLNIYGLKWKTKNIDGDFVVSRYRRDSWSRSQPVKKSYTSKQLDEIAEPLGIKKWRKHWKKDQKIQCLMKTEV